MLPRKDLHHPIPAATYNPAAILAPHDSTDPFSSHKSMAREFLDATPLFEAPEPEAGVVAGGDEFPAVRGKGEGGDGGGVGEHGVSALAFGMLVCAVFAEVGKVEDGGKKECHTAISVKEADILIFMPA